MKGLIVGEKDCSINKIVLAMDQCNCSKQLMEEWRKLARALDTPNERIYEREQDLLLKGKSALDVIVDLLFDWRARMADEASFERLLDILEYQCGWKAISDNLWNTFRTHMTEDVTWTRLDMRSRNKIMESQLEFQGQRKSLQSIFNSFCEAEMEKMLSGSTILKLLRGERVALFNKLIPETPFCYIPRVLASRRRIKPEIFQRKCADIFVVEGISLSELSGVAGNESIAKSSNQRKKLTSRFIQLDLPDGFEIVTKISKHVPVHRFSFNSGSFYWVKSSGNVGLIQEYIHTDQASVNEEEFLSVLQEDYNKNLSVCIADIPGMGKTFLLANLARQRTLQAGDKTLVFFIPLSQFLDGIDTTFECNHNLCQERVCGWIAKCVSQNELGQEITSKMLCSQLQRVEIYFDGYDELSEQKQVFTTNIIKCLVNEFKHVYTAITTRVHKRHQLEQTLQVLSFNIEPFQHDDQLHFFKQFWNDKYNFPLNTNLQRFANFVVSKIRETFPSAECDVVGIPLQCSMLADILANDALGYSNDTTLPLELSLDINSVHDMYTALIAKRFGTCQGYELIEMKKIHGYAALHSVLPEVAPAPKIAPSRDDFTKITSIGILIVEKNCNPAKFEFVHHTYAEFILANFLVDGLVSQATSGESNLFNSWTLEELFLAAMSLSEDDPEIHINSRDCTINSLYGIIRNSKESDKLRTNWEALVIKLSMSNADVVETKATVDLYNSRGVNQDPIYLLLQQWTKHLKVQRKLSQLLDSLRHLGYREIAEKLKSAYSNRTFTKKNVCFFMDRILQQKNVLLSQNMFTYFRLDDDPGQLHNILAASLNHNFSSLFALMSQRCLSIKRKHANLPKVIPWWSNLMINAVKSSSPNLVVECCDFVEGMGECKLNEIEWDTASIRTFVYSPLHEAAERGDFTIFDFLFKKFGPCALQMEGLMHCCVQFSLTNSEALIGETIQIIKLIAGASKKFLNEFDNAFDQRTPILMPNVHIKLLTCMIDMGADINAIDNGGDTVAHAAARYLSPTDFHTLVTVLLTRGAKDLFYLCLKTDSSRPINIAAENIELKPETIRLLSTHLGDSWIFSFPDWKGDDALSCAVAGLRTRAVLEMFVKCGADPKRLRKDKQGILHLAAIHGHVDAISYFVSLECKVNSRDVNGRTPLHLALLFGRRNVDSVVRTLLEHNAKADMKDIHGHKAIWYGESEDKLWLLEPGTRDTLVKASRKKPVWGKLCQVVRDQF